MIGRDSQAPNHRTGKINTKAIQINFRQWIEKPLIRSLKKISLRLDTDVNCNLYTNIYIENLQEILHAK